MSTAGVWQGGGAHRQLAPAEKPDAAPVEVRWKADWSPGDSSPRRGARPFTDPAVQTSGRRADGSDLRQTLRARTATRTRRAAPCCKPVVRFLGSVVVAAADCVSGRSQRFGEGSRLNGVQEEQSC